MNIWKTNWHFYRRFCPTAWLNRGRTSIPGCTKPFTFTGSSFTACGLTISRRTPSSFGYSWRTRWPYYGSSVFSPELEKSFIYWGKGIISETSPKGSLDIFKFTYILFVWEHELVTSENTRNEDDTIYFVFSACIYFRARCTRISRSLYFGWIKIKSWICWNTYTVRSSSRKNQNIEKW